MPPRARTRLAPWLNTAPLDDHFARQHARDELGTRLHLAIAALGCLALAGPTSIAEIAFAPTLIYAIVRLNNMWRTLWFALGQPAVLAWCALTAWSAITLLWTPDRAQGLDMLGMFRWPVLAILIWPVMDRRPVLVRALAIGFLLGQLSQLAHALGTRFDIPSITWNRLPDRNSGWWDPVVGGSLLTAALGLHLPAAVFGRGRTRWLALAGSAITLLGIFATGTRGAWIASAALITITLALAAWRARKAVRPRTLIAGAIACVVLAGITAALTGSTIAARYAEARTEITDAIDNKEFQSSTGARMLMAWWALEAAGERPITGIGLGGFRAWSLAHLQAQDIDPETRDLHAHAHNAALHTLAETGAVGLALLALFTAALIASAARRIAWHTPPTDDRPDALGSYDAGPLFAVLGLILVSGFDPVHLNTQTAALLGVLIALCPALRPPPLDPPTSLPA